MSTNGLHPAEASHRSSEIAFDIAIILAKLIDGYGRFISKAEMFHLQMQCLYVLIDIMGATHGSDPRMVLKHCEDYFKSLERERCEQ